MPTPTDYIYSVLSDTATGDVMPSRLDLEIRESDIITALEAITVEGDVLTITFKDPLSTLNPDDVTNLNDVVATHEGEVLDSIEPKLNDQGELVTSISGGETQIGMQAIQVLNTPDMSSDFVKSWQVTANPQTTGILDIFIGGDLVGPTGLCYLAGGEYRCRDSAYEGSALHFSIVDRNDVLGLFGLYGLNRTKLTGLTGFLGGVIGDVVNGYHVQGQTSGAVAKILAVGADSFDVEFHESNFQDGEVLTILDASESPTGITCTLGTWDEGDVVVVQDSLKDEWIEGWDNRDIQPGGSKRVPEGMYFRVKLYNNSTVASLRVKVSLTVGRL